MRNITEGKCRTSLHVYVFCLGSMNHEAVASCDLQHHWLNCRPNPWQYLHRVLQMAVDTVVPLPWPKKYFQAIFCVICHSSPFSPHFPSLRMTSWPPPLHWGQILIQLQWTADESTEGPDVSLKSISSEHAFQKPDTSSVVLYFYSFLIFFKSPACWESLCCCKNPILCPPNCYLWPFS